MRRDRRHPPSLRFGGQAEAGDLGLFSFIPPNGSPKAIQSDRRGGSSRRIGRQKRQRRKARDLRFTVRPPKRIAEGNPVIETRFRKLSLIKYSKGKIPGFDPGSHCGTIVFIGLR